MAKNTSLSYCTCLKLQHCDALYYTETDPRWSDISKHPMLLLTTDVVSVILSSMSAIDISKLVVTTAPKRLPKMKAPIVRKMKKYNEAPYNCETPMLELQKAITVSSFQNCTCIYCAVKVKHPMCTPWNYLVPSLWHTVFWMFHGCFWHETKSFLCGIWFSTLCLVLLAHENQITFIDQLMQKKKNADYSEGSTHPLL